MPIRVRASKDLGLVLFDFEGVVTLAEFERLAVPLVDQPGYALMPSMLVDMSLAKKVDGPSEIIRRQARLVGEKVDGEIAPGAKLALVATNPEFFGLSRMYQTLRSDSPVEVSIFRTREEAETWLGLPAGYEEQLSEITVS
jgi:hypothetical protein